MEEGMTPAQIQTLADNERTKAKRLLGEATGRGGYLNPELPISQFVDAVINCAILEMTAIRAKAQEPKP